MPESWETFEPVKTGKCWCCEATEVKLDNSGVCEDCFGLLKKQQETGRCSWCGNPIDECTCDEEDL